MPSGIGLEAAGKVEARARAGRGLGPRRLGRGGGAEAARRGGRPGGREGRPGARAERCDGPRALARAPVQLHEHERRDHDVRTR